jgi:hypothetical protein
MALTKVTYSMIDGASANVLDYGADATGVSDSRAAFQAAVTAVIAAGRGTVFVPSGTYLINGVASADSFLNGVLVPWDNNYDTRPYLRIVGDGGVTIKAGSNDMVVFRASTTFVEISGICIDGNSKTNVIGIGIWPENTGNVTLTAPVSQSYFLSHSVTIKNCYIGMDFQPGVTDTTNRQSGCFYHAVYDYHGNTNTQHLVFSYPYDYNTSPSATNQNYTTRSGFYSCSFINGNVGVYAKGVGDIYFYNTNCELINSTSNTRGAAPLATPTGVYVSSQGTFAKVVQMFGGYIEACTETIYNGRTNGVQTVGTIYSPPTTGNFANIVNLGRDGLTLAYDSAGAAIKLTPIAQGGLEITADPTTAPAVRISDTSASGTLRGQRWTFPNASPNDTTSYFQTADDATEVKYVVWSNGTVQNRTGTFSAISDIRLKQDIASAPSYWNKFKDYEFVNFAFKTAPNEKMLGVIAQQIEQISPSLVYETVDDDGGVTKAVKSSIMATVAQVVLQEAQKRIEELEQRVANLEAQK